MPETNQNIKTHSSNRNVLLHIGYHKTGTSFLQSRFFVSKFGFERWPEDQRTIHPHLVDIGPFDDVSPESTNLLHHLAHQAGTRNRCFAISHERLSGHYGSGGYDAKAIAQRLCEVFPNAKVLIVLREQCSLIRSAYSQFVTEGGSLSLRRFLRDPQPGLRKVPTFSLSHFEFSPLIKFYRSIFGANQVLVLPYELFASDPLIFLNRIGQFALEDNWRNVGSHILGDEVVNRGLPVMAQHLRRHLNAVFFRNQFSNCGYLCLPKLVRSFQVGVARFGWVVPQPIDRRMVASQRKIVEEFVGDRYRSFNRETQELIGIDLESLGYPVN